MKRIKIGLCLLFAAAFAGFELSRSSAVNGQVGGSALSAPTGVEASDNAYNTKVQVRWNAIRGATLYRVYRNSVDNFATATDIGTTANIAFNDGGAPQGQTSFYWVRAENSSTASDPSQSDQGTRAATPGNGPFLNPPPQPQGNPTTATKVYLGKALFWDEQMSSTRTVACGTCHHSGNGGSDPRSVAAANASLNVGFDGILGTPDDVRGSQGVPSTNVDGTYTSIQNYGLKAQVTGRKSVSYLNAGYAPSLFWDGRATGTFTDPITNAVVLANGAALESQVLGPPVSTAEMGHAGRDWSDVANRIASSKPLALSPSVPAALQTWINGRTYPELFLEAFGDTNVTPARIAMAIASFERSLYTDRAPVDLAAAGIQPLSAAAQRGQGLFNGPGTNCSACHAGPQFSDNNFHDIGVRPANEDTGRQQFTGSVNSAGQFKTPGLRNVDLRQSFFHNGRFTTLEQVVAFYNRGGDFGGPQQPNTNPNKDPRIHPLNLNPGQQADLVAFLHALTDPRVVTEQAPFDRPTLYTESNRVPVQVGSGVAGSGNFTPQIQAISPPIDGNPNFTVSLSGALGGANATLVVATRNYTSMPARRGRGLFRGAVVTNNSGAGNGWASLSFPIPDDARAGTTYYARWFIEDPSAPGGYSVTPAMQFTLFAANTAPATVLGQRDDAVDVVRLGGKKASATIE